MSNWTVKMSNTRGVPYYYNSTDKTSSWNPPTGVRIQGLPGAECLRDIAKADIFEYGGLLGQVRVSHLLVKHRDSRKPRNLRGESITITREEAIARAKQYLTKIHEVKGEEARNMFVALTKKHSDCSSGARGGDLGWFDRGQMQAEFERVAYALPIRHISDIGSTTSGVHLIMKTGGAIQMIKDLEDDSASGVDSKSTNNKLTSQHDTMGEGHRSKGIANTTTGEPNFGATAQFGGDAAVEGSRPNEEESESDSEAVHDESRSNAKTGLVQLVMSGTRRVVGRGKSMLNKTANTLEDTAFKTDMEGKATAAAEEPGVVGARKTEEKRMAKEKRMAQEGAPEFEAKRDVDGTRELEKPPTDEARQFEEKRLTDETLELEGRLADGARELEGKHLADEHQQNL